MMKTAPNRDANPRFCLIPSQLTKISTTSSLDEMPSVDVPPPGLSSSCLDAICQATVMEVQGY